jgi:geranylgeranyl diphosphate synthase type II
MMDKEKRHNAEAFKQIFEAYLFEEAPKSFPGVLLDAAMQILQMKAKRIRPVLLLTACEAFGGDYHKALPAAAAIEFYHNFTLVHDDIIDEADIRRNATTVHKAFGVNKAILAGDAMLLHAFHLLQAGEETLDVDLLRTFENTAAQVIEGEQYDVDFEDREEVSLEEYIEMIRLKTSVLLGAALKMGAIVGGASIADREAIYRFGLNLGLAFQIKDDYLDSFGDQKTFGKKIGGDILQNKKTFLLCMALKKADQTERETIFELFNEKDERRKIEGMIKMYKKLEVDKETFETMEDYYQKALDAFDLLSLPDAKRTALLDLANLIYHRSY